MGLSFLSDTARLKRIVDLLQEVDSPALPAGLDLVNRALRPTMVLGVLGLVALAFADPPRYSAGMAALRGTPWPVWALAAIIIALHFLTKSGAAPRASAPRT